MTDWRDVFERLLQDGRVSRTERRALRELAASEIRTAQERARVRALAFDVAREGLSRHAPAEVLAWAEDIVSALASAVPTPGTASPSEAWFSPGPAPLRCIQRQIRMTRRRMDVCVFTITDDRIVGALVEAVRRRVLLRVVSDDEKRDDLGSDLERLARAGAQVRIDRSPDHMHHKFAVFDGVRLLTGSYNWTRSAARGNSENLLVTTEGALVAAYSAEFERVWGGARAL